MTAAKAIEYRIIRRLLEHPPEGEEGRARRILERMIAVIAATAVVFVLGSYLQELLWAAFAAAVVAVLGSPEN